jgi:hypothetical protein
VLDKRRHRERLVQGICVRGVGPKWANRAGWVECWCWAVVGKKRKEWVAGLYRGKEKGGGGLGWLGNMAQEGFGKF